MQLLKRELEPEKFNEIFVEGGIFDGALVDFLNELFPNANIPEYPGLPEVPDEGWRCMKGISLRNPFHPLSENLIKNSLLDFSNVKRS